MTIYKNYPEKEATWKDVAVGWLVACCVLLTMATAFGITHRTPVTSTSPTGDKLVQSRNDIRI